MSRNLAVLLLHLVGCASQTVPVARGSDGGRDRAEGAAPHPPSVTVLLVSYGLDKLDLSWVPAQVPVVIVHNDERLGTDAVLNHPLVVHAQPGRNLGFGQGVMFGLEHVDTERVVLCNPDVVLGDAHWSALSRHGPLDLGAVPLVDGQGRPTVVASGYPHPPAVLLTALRLGRLAPRGGRRRRLLGLIGGRWAATHVAALTSAAGSWPLSERWLSGAVLSIETTLLRAIPFDQRFFLYFEDVDLCTRIARLHPTSRAVVAAVEPALHRVGGSATTREAAAIAALARWQSAAAYARTRRGGCWAATAAALAAAAWLLRHGPGRWRQAARVVPTPGARAW